MIHLIAIALFIIMSVILIKYKLVCEVIVNGEKIGNISDKEKFEKSIEEFINAEEANKEYTMIENMPEYKMAFIDKSEEVNDESVLAILKENSETTYKLYAVTVDGKEKAILENLDEAEALVKELSNQYEKTLNTKIGIIEKYTTNNKDGVTEVKTAKTSITKELKAAVAKKEADKAAKEAEEAQKATSYTAASTSTKVASLNGVKLTVRPVSGTITSRFGSRESIRSSGHTGLDIAAPAGTKIKAAAAGTVIFSGYSGGYGYLVKISHGSGITTYYGHCSKLYVSEGDKVAAGDVIAAVGSTGNSTGNHLHFEVVKNGVELNPQNYLYKGE